MTLSLMPPALVFLHQSMPQSRNADTATSVMDPHFLAISTFLGLPGLLVGLVTMTPLFGCCKQWTLDSRPAEHVLRQERSERNPSFPSVPAFVLKDVLQEPRVFPYALFLVLTLLGVCLVRRNASRVKAVLFATILAVLTTIRVLSSASGSIHYYDLDVQVWQPWNSGSPFKAWFLYYVIEAPLWDRTHLSRYCDLTHSSLRLTFRDAVVRLAYFHVVDNAVHVLWLRFFWPINYGEPFTHYVNNSEILTAVLGVLMVVWTGLKVGQRGRALRTERTNGAEGVQDVVEAAAVQPCEKVNLVEGLQ